MASQPQQKMHGRLSKLGVVRRVRDILAAPHEVAQISDLTCWVETELEGDTIAVFVKAAFVQHPQPKFRGQPAGRPFRNGASFRVQRRMPFGSIADQPLPDELVKSIYEVGGVTLEG